MSEELIDNIFDVKAIEDQVKTIEGYLDKLKIEMAGYSESIKKTMAEFRGAKDIEELIKNTKNFNDAIAQGARAATLYTETQKNLEAQEKKLIQAQARQATELTATNLETQRLNKETREKNKIAQLEATLTDANAGKQEKLKAEIALLRIQKEKLKETDADYAKTITALNKKIDENTDELKKNDDAEQKRKGGIGEYAKQLSFLQKPMALASDGFKMLGVSEGIALWPIALIIGAIAALAAIFKTFDPVVDKIQQGMAALGAVLTTLKESVIGLITGQKKLSDTFKELGGNMRDAANEAIAMEKKQQELDDMNLKLTASSAKYKRQIDELLLQSKNKKLSEEEAMKLIDEAMGLEEKAYQEKKAIADKELEIAIQKIEAGRNLTDEQKKQLREGSVEAAIALKDTKAVTDAEIQAYADALANQESILNESVSLREKAQNRSDALDNKAAAKAEKAAAAAEKAAEKKAADEEKAYNAKRKLIDAELNAMEDGQAKQIAISEEQYRRQIEDLQKNGKLSGELQASLKKAHERDIQKIKDDAAKAAADKAASDFEKTIADFEKNTQNEVDALNLANAQKELELKQSYSKGLISKKEYEDGLIKIQDEAAKKANDKTIEFLKKELEIADISADKKAEIQAKLIDLQIANEDLSLKATIEANDKKLESDKTTAEKRKEINKQIFAAGIDLFSEVASFQKEQSERRLNEIEAEKQASENSFKSRQDNLNDSLMSDASREAAQKKIDEDKAKRDAEFAKRVQDEKIKQARWNKAQGLINAIVSTATAVTQSLPNFILAALVGAAGALQIATITSQPIPAFEKGGVTGDGLALWGEVRPEVAVSPAGQIMFAEKPTVSNFDAGTRIYKSVQDFELAMMKKENGGFAFDYDKMAEKMPSLNVNLDHNGLWNVINKQGNRRTLINSRHKLF